MRIFTLAVSLSLVAACSAEKAPPPAPTFTPERFRAHVAFLADDLLEGRDTGSRGHEIAARYVATEFDSKERAEPVARRDPRCARRRGWTAGRLAACAQRSSDSSVGE